MGKYKKCPRCELNWIPNEEELCEVCKVELGKASKLSLLEDEDDDEIAGFGERICPICKENYLDADEDICPKCRAERAEKERDKSEDDGWEAYMDDEEPMTSEDEEGDLLLSQLQDEELDELDEDEEERPIDDFEELDESDLLGFDEDDEDESSLDSDDDF